MPHRLSFLPLLKIRANPAGETQAQTGQGKLRVRDWDLSALSIRGFASTRICLTNTVSACLAPIFSAVAFTTSLRYTEAHAGSMSQEEHSMAGLEDEDLEAQLAELEQVFLMHTQPGVLKGLGRQIAPWDLT